MVRQRRVRPGDPDRAPSTARRSTTCRRTSRCSTDVGVRPDWSPDGQHFSSSTRAARQRLAIRRRDGQTRKLSPATSRTAASRAPYYLHNGDLLLCGPTSGPLPTRIAPRRAASPGAVGAARAVPQRPPQPLGMPCWEGIGASRTSMRIAWNRSDIDYTDSDLVDRVVNGISEIWTGEIRYLGGRATLVERRACAGPNRRGSPIAVLEVQDFRPRGERELIFTAYAYQGGEVIGPRPRDRRACATTRTAASTRRPRASSPDGGWVLVERDLESTAIPGRSTSGGSRSTARKTWERLTYFNRYRGGYYASNPAFTPTADASPSSSRSTGRSRGRARHPALRPRALRRRRSIGRPVGPGTSKTWGQREPGGSSSAARRPISAVRRGSACSIIGAVTSSGRGTS